MNWLEKANATLTQENADLTQKQAEAEKAKLIAETKATVEDAISKADLPEPAKARLLERYKDADKADGLTEAITAEAEYIVAISGGGVVKGLGPKPEKDESGTKALTESMKRAHPEWTDKQIEIAVRGR